MRVPGPRALVLMTVVAVHLGAQPSAQSGGAALPPPASASVAPPSATQAPSSSPAPSVDAAIAPRSVGSMSDLMVKIIYPTSDAVFYITSRTPQTQAEWTVLEGQTLMLAESANILMLPPHIRDQGQWMADARLLREAGLAAYRAARRKDVAGLDALNDQMYQSCTTCHMHYRPNYGRRPTPPQ